MKTKSVLPLSFADQNPNIIFSYSVTNSKFLYTNSAFKAAFQRNSNPPLVSKLFEMVGEKDRGFLKGVYTTLKSGIFRDNVEFRMQFENREEQVFKLGLLKEVRENNEEIITGSMEDISAFRTNEDTLNELTERKNAILNILSHDLAGPLNSIKTFTYLVSKKLSTEADKQLHSMLTSIEKLSENCIQMLQEFIQLEFIKSVNVDLIKERKDLVTAVENIRQQYLNAQQELNIAFEFKTNKPQIYVQLDENKFMQVINNLISNSIKFTPDGGKITLSLEEKEDIVLVTLADNGVGIPKAHHATLFDKFSSARRPGLKGEPSVGLGMSIIKTIVEWHKGKIWFESEEEKGTTFYIEVEKSV